MDVDTNNIIENPKIRANNINPGTKNRYWTVLFCFIVIDLLVMALQNAAPY